MIPAGNYGAGSVIIWDRGWFRSFKPEDVAEQYRRGKLELELFGFKLRGRWTLVRMGKKEKEWLLLKKAGAGSSERELVERYPQSVVTGLTVEEQADVAGTRERVRAAIADLGAPRRAVALAGQPLMLATLAEQPFDGADWVFEVKYDGVRVLAQRRGDRVEMAGRSGQSITGKYPEIAAALAALPHDDFLVDGEIVATDDEGRPSFQRLQARMGLARPRDVEQAMREVPVSAIFFDALAAGGFDLRRLPLVDRKRALRLLLPPLGTVRYGDHVERHGVRFYEAASELRLEGIVAKRASSAYAGARSRDWIKIKCQRRQEFVIGGWTDPQGGRGYLGALHVGLHRGGRLVYVTRVGTGFDQKGLREMHERLAPLAREDSPFVERSPKGRGHHWVEPRLVCEVRFTEWTRDGGLRHPTFLGLRDDQRPEECVFEEPAGAAGPEAAGEPEAGPAETPKARPAPRGRAAARAFPVEERVVRLSNLDKVFWPEAGYTKGDLIAYHDAIAPLMLPYLRDRPIFTTRYPDGIHGKSFYQKDAPVFVPDWVRTERIYSGGDSDEIRYFVIDDAAMLRYIVNLGTIPIHAWSSRVGSLERPDWTILDLDPKGAPFLHVVQVARTLKQVIDELELPSFVKTSGATGLHVLVPLAARYTYEQARAFARVLATVVVQRQPEIATVVRAVRGREGKVYVDFGQNGYGQSIVAAFSARPVPEASVSCPLEWDEVTPRLQPSRFTLKSVPKRFARREDPMRAVLGEGIRIEDALERLGKRLEG